jgi:hypothetical protein
MSDIRYCPGGEFSIAISQDELVDMAATLIVNNPGKSVLLLHYIPTPKKDETP